MSGRTRNAARATALRRYRPFAEPRFNERTTPAAHNRSPVVLNAPERSCMIAPPARPARSGEAHTVPATSSRPCYKFCGRIAQPDARHARPVNTPASALANLVLREDLLGPLNRLFQSNLRRDPVFDDLGPGVREDMLVLHLRVGWVVGP